MPLVDKGAITLAGAADSPIRRVAYKCTCKKSSNIGKTQDRNGRMKSPLYYKTEDLEDAI